jgi:peptide/nickel transport system ATP-binding protein
MVPSLREPIAGCAFAPRCALADDRCRSVSPSLMPVPGHPAHTAACLKLDAVEAIT